MQVADYKIITHKRVHLEVHPFSYKTLIVSDFRITD